MKLLALELQVVHFLLRAKLFALPPHSTSKIAAPWGGMVVVVWAGIRPTSETRSHRSRYTGYDPG